MKNFIVLLIIIIVCLWAIYMVLDMLQWVLVSKARVERVVYQAIDDETKFITTRENIYEIVNDTLRKQHLTGDNVEGYYEWKCKNKGKV